jgi:hypothetical protein
VPIRVGKELLGEFKNEILLYLKYVVDLYWRDHKIASSKAASSRVASSPRGGNS